MAESANCEQLWEQMTELLHKGNLNPALWEAVDAVTPVVVDGDTLVVGLRPARMQHAGYIETSQNKSQLQDLLEKLVGQRLDIRVISGTSLEDWQRTKAREAAGVEETAAKVRARTAQKEARAIWQEGGERVANIFTGARARARGTDLAQLMMKAIQETYQIEQDARAEAGDAEELHGQQVNRIIDRIATYCNVSATVVALEYLRYCRQQQ